MRTSASWPAARSSSQRAGRAAVLPDERAVQRLAGLRVPDADGLALVRDADRRQLAVRSPRPRAPRSATARVTSQISPASCSTQPGLREVLLELAVGAAGELRVGVEDEAGRAGRALVDREDHERDATRRAGARSRRAEEQAGTGRTLVPACIPRNPEASSPRGVSARTGPRQGAAGDGHDRRRCCDPRYAGRRGRPTDDRPNCARRRFDTRASQAASATRAGDERRAPSHSASSGRAARRSGLAPGPPLADEHERRAGHERGVMDDRHRQP